MIRYSMIMHVNIFLLSPYRLFYYGYAGLAIYKDSLWTSFLGVCRFVFCNAQRNDRLNVKQRKQLRGKGRALHHNFFFSTGLCEDETESERDNFFGQSIRNSLTTQEQEALPRQHSDVRTATRLALHFWAPGARHGKVLIDARPGRSRHRLFPAQEQSARQWCRWPPGASSEETGAMEQLYSYNAFFTYPIIMYFNPESPVPPASCTVCERRGASKEKKCVGSWFVAESGPLGGELSWKYFSQKAFHLELMKGHIHVVFFIWGHSQPAAFDHRL